MILVVNCIIIIVVIIMNELEVIRIINRMVDNTRSIELSYVVNRLIIDKID